MLYTDKEQLTNKVSELEEGAYHLLSKEEYQTMLENFKKTEILTEVNKQIGEKVKETHDKYDADFKEYFGEKSADEKTYNWIRRNIEDLKSKAEGKHDESEEFKKFKKEASTKISERDAAIEKLQSSIKQEKYRSTLTQAMAGFEFNENVPESLRQMAIDAKFNELVANAREEDGNIVWKLNGVDLHDEAYNPLTAKSVIDKVFGDIKKSVTGGGGGDTPPKKEGNMDAQTAVELLKKEGLKVGTPSFQTKFKELTGIGSKEKE